MSLYLKVFIVSVLPIFELRGAIPMGIALGYEPVYVFFVAFLGSILPSPFIYFCSKSIFAMLRNTDIFKSFVTKLSSRTLKKGRNIKRYGFLGLVLFVGIPLPGTGVWTGSLAASLLNLDFKKSFVSIVIGNLIAGIVLIFISCVAFSST